MSPRHKPQATRVVTLAEIPDKMYFRIGEVAAIVDVKPYVLRYWETEFPALRPQKSRSRQRMYRRRDVELLLKIKHLLYDRKYTIAGARQLMKGGIKALPDPVVDPPSPATVQGPQAEPVSARGGDSGASSVSHVEQLAQSASDVALDPSGMPASALAGWQSSTPAREAATPVLDAESGATEAAGDRDQLSFDLRVPLAMRADLQKALLSLISYCDEADAEDRDPFDQLRRREGSAGTTSVERAVSRSDR